MFLDVSEWAVLLIFMCANGVWATPINRISGAFRDGSTCANSDGSNLVIILYDFEDFGVVGGLEMVSLVEFHVF